MKEPTQEQVREFWEWCGFTLRCSPEKDAYGRGIWNYPEGTFGDLELDLNNMFKYAVPKAIERIMQECDEELAYAIIFKKWLQRGHDADTLFWAIWDVIKESE